MSSSSIAGMETNFFDDGQLDYQIVYSGGPTENLVVRQIFGSGLGRSIKNDFFTHTTSLFYL